MSISDESLGKAECIQIRSEQGGVYCFAKHNLQPAADGSIILRAVKSSTPSHFQVRAVAGGGRCGSEWSAPTPPVPFEVAVAAKMRTQAAEFSSKIKAKIDAGVFDDELAGYVATLKQYQKDVPALCGTEWLEWREPGVCQVCGVQVDRKEKGLHCKAGGHRICWACMVEAIDWVEYTKKDPERLMMLCQE